MEKRPLHRWDLDPAEAVQLQKALRSQVAEGPLGRPVRRIGGIDVAYSRGTSRLWAGAVVMEGEGLEIVGVSWAQDMARFPYVPGLLAFREIPCILKALEGLRPWPDVFLCDGQGRAHPRGMGLACHLGLWIHTPTVGCAKSRLVGEFQEPRLERGARAVLRYKGEVVGVVLRTRTGVRPVFVSPGYGVDLDEAAAIVLHCTRKRRLPEPLREAHALVTGLRRRGEEA